MVISSKDSLNIKLIGKAKESKTYKEYTEVWEKDEIFFKKKGTVTQRIQLLNKDITATSLNFSLHKFAKKYVSRLMKILLSL